MMMEPDAIKSPMYVTKASDTEKPKNTQSSLFTADANSGGDDDNDDGFVVLWGALNSRCLLGVLDIWTCKRSFFLLRTAMLTSMWFPVTMMLVM